MNDEALTRERLKRARAFIDTCYDLPLDLERISSEASFSRYHFIRLFRRVYEQTPHQYLIQKRIEKAKDLLSSSELTVTEVCFAVGFQSLGSFSALFHRSVGHPPKVYRTRMLERRRLPQRFVPACFLTMFGIERPPGT
jgi:AraC-like DNA-binding protein